MATFPAKADGRTGPGATTGGDERWLALVKTTREEHQVGLFEAQRMALSDPHWRRWVDQRINTDARCRRQALHHIRSHGSDALLTGEGGRLRVR